MATPFNQGGSTVPLVLSSSNIFMYGNVFGSSGEQLTQGAALTQKIQDLAGGFSNGVPGLMTSSSIVGTGMAQSTLSPFTNALEGSIYFPGVYTGNYISTTNSTLLQNWKATSMTLELWVNYPSFSNTSSALYGSIQGSYTIGSFYPATASGASWSFGALTSGLIGFYYWDGSTAHGVTGGATLSTNTWNHICVQSDGTNVYLFVNGALQTLTGSNWTTSGSYAAIIGTPAYSSPFSIGTLQTNVGPNMYIASARLTYGANLYSQGSFTAPTGPLGPAPTGQTVMLLRNPLYSAMTLKNPLNALSSVRVRCLPSDALIYLDAFGSNLPNKAPLSNAPTFDPYGTGAVLFRNANSNYLDFGPQTWNVITRGFTAIVKLQLTGTPYGYEGIFGFPTNATAGNNINIIALGRNQAFGQLTFSVFNAAGSGTVSINTQTMYQDVPYVIACVYDPFTSGGVATVYQNGTVVSTSSTGLNASLVDRLNLNSYVGALYGAGTTYNSSQNIYTLAVWNRALSAKEITDATATLTQTAPVVPSTIEFGNVNGRPALTVDPTGSVNVLGPLNGATGAAAPVDLGINSLSLATGNLTSNISVTSFSPLGPTEGSLYFPYGAANANTYITPGSGGVPFTNSNIYTSDFLMELWVNPTTIQTSPFVAYGLTNIGACDWGLGLNGTSGQIGWYNNIGGVGTWIYSPTGAVSANTWQHVALIFQLTNRRIQIYVNGQPQVLSGSGSVTISGTVGTYSSGIPANTGNFLTIGQNGYFGSSVPYNGYLTNLRVVTGSGAAQIYNNNAFVPSTSPLFPASNTAGGSLTTRLLVRVPATKGQTNISKIGPASGVLAFPPAPMTGYSTNLTGLSPYGQGTYVASASTEVNNLFLAWYAFDQIVGNWWTSAIQYNGSSPYNYTGSVTTVDVNGNSYAGEWIQIQLPCAIVPVSYTITQASSGVNQQYSPTKFWILGSRDGANWSLVDSRTGATSVWAVASPTFTVTSSQAFSYYRLVGNILLGNGTAMSISQIIFNGSIESINVTADGRVGVGVITPTRALEVAGDVVCAGTLSAGNPLMFRNRIINGDMRIWQRGTTISAVASSYTADRWLVPANSTSWAVTQVAGPWGSTGFQYAIQLVSSTTFTNPSIIEQRVEQYNVADFIQGTPFVVSFWARQTGGTLITMNVQPLLPSATNNFATLTIASTPSVVGVALTSNWQYYTCQFAVSVTGVATNGLDIQFWDTTSISSASPITVQITGVQLEKGTVATPFEIRPYATELALCQRYYFRTADAQNNCALMVGGVETATSAAVGMIFPVTMRSNPTATLGASLRFYSASTGTITPSILAQRSSTTNGGLYLTIAAATQGQAAYLYNYAVAGSYVEFNSEL